eukprot:TRINITY_DN23484_c0_g2_i1.p1 TRINITY_DN23484_c0_g2~~TRINITY_DN23484_c0_g2_i1.p1  ORF type:complete len:493 (+),score=17.11 TRINITY_DN23484_c0_g2_i1:56-1534(+)
MVRQRVLWYWGNCVILLACLLLLISCAPRPKLDSLKHSVLVSKLRHNREQARRSTTGDATHDYDVVDSLPGLKQELLGTQFAGYSSIYGRWNSRPQDVDDESLFYWFVGKGDGANYSHHPTIIWTNGGPGSTSLWGFWLENGPFTVNEAASGLASEITLSPSSISWTQHANYLVFDHPLGVGLSNTSSGSLPPNVTVGVQQWYQSLLNFLIKHPEIMRNPIILTGESYAGTYIPLLAKLIVDWNPWCERTYGQRIDFRGMMLADAWVNPMVQMRTDIEYAFNHGLISEAQALSLRQLPLNQVGSKLFEIAGVNSANIATDDGPMNAQWDVVMKYLNRADVRKALHAGDTPITGWSSGAIEKLYQSTVNDNHMKAVQELVDHGVKTMIVSGLNDMKDCNFLGTQAWLRLLQGDVADSFQKSETRHWKPGKRVLGYIQESDNRQLTWIKVLNAGHMAVLDQPLLIHLIMDNLLGQTHLIPRSSAAEHRLKSVSI